MTDDDSLDPVMTGWKCWRNSSGMVAGVIGLAVSALKLLGYTIEPEYEKSIVDLIGLLTIIACFLGALYGRFFAKTRIGTPEFHDKLSNLFRKEPE